MLFHSGSFIFSSKLAYLTFLSARLHSSSFLFLFIFFLFDCWFFLHSYHCWFTFILYPILILCWSLYQVCPRLFSQVWILWMTWTIQSDVRSSVLRINSRKKGVHFVMATMVWFLKELQQDKLSLQEQGGNQCNCIIIWWYPIYRWWTIIAGGAPYAK